MSRAHPRAIVLLAMALALLSIMAAQSEHPKRWIYNASPSMPLGWYRLGSASQISIGDIVLIPLPAPYLSLAAQRHYLPAGVPLLKPVAALAPQWVCRVNNRLLIDGQDVTRLQEKDTAGRALEGWRGCRQLREGEMFVISNQRSDSFDSRYFGPLRVRNILGKAVPVRVER